MEQPASHRWGGREPGPGAGAAAPAAGSHGARPDPAAGPAGQQRRWLDRFAGEALLDSPGAGPGGIPLLENGRGGSGDALADAERLQEERRQRELLLADLEAAQIWRMPASAERLQSEEDRLAHGVRLQEGVMTLLGRLVEGAEQAPSVLDHLGACQQELEQMEGLDPSLKPNPPDLRRWLCGPAGPGPRPGSLRRHAGERPARAWRSCRSAWPSSRGSSGAMARIWAN